MGPFCFYKLRDEHRAGVHCINCHRVFSHKDDTVGRAADLPPFNGAIIKNDGQIKIEKPNIGTQNKSTSLTVKLLRREVCGSGAEAKSDFIGQKTSHCFFQPLQPYYQINLWLLCHSVREMSE